jgi:hypothetical protein
MAKYLFRLEKAHLNAQRNHLKENFRDIDVITFGIEVGARQYGPLKNYGLWQSGSGADLDFTNAGLREDANGVARGRWEIGPIDVADGDLVSVGYAVVNAEEAISRARSSHGDTSATTSQISVAAWAGLLGVAGAATGGFAAVVLAIDAGLLAVAGLLIKDPLNCDGVVGANKRFFTEVELRQGTNNPQQTLLISDRSGTTDAPSGCGQSDIIMTLSVTFVPYYSMKAFLISKSALASAHWSTGMGFRNYTKSILPSFYSGPSTSVRDVIENWELLVIS